VGWRERDWAKFNDDERRALFGGGQRGLPPSDEGAAYRPTSVSPAPRRRITKRRHRLGEWTLAALLLLGLFAFGYDHLHPAHRIQSLTLSPVSPLSTAVPKTKTVVVAPPSDLVSIRWRATDLAPAAAAGRICLTDSRHGRICASYVVGERPADTLTRRMEGLGLRVESSG
jgi:hypothetical protein